MVLYIDKYDSRKQIVEKNTYIRVDGGDGTLLTAIHDFAHLNKPFYGVAGGTKNFLMNECPIKAPTAIVVKFNLLKVTIHFVDQTKASCTVEAFNDILIGSFGGYVTFTSTHKDNQVSEFRGASLVVSTAQGSTGINLNSEGVVLPLTSKDWAITNAQATKKVRVVVNPTPLIINTTARDSVKVNVDGKGYTYDGISSVLVEQGREVNVIFNDIHELQLKRQN